MNLFELPDKDFDSRFRTAADSAGYTFSEEGWEGLEKKLNRWERFGPAFRRISGGLIIVLMGMVVFLIIKSPGAGETENSFNQIVQHGIIDIPDMAGPGLSPDQDGPGLSPDKDGSGLSPDEDRTSEWTGQPAPGSNENNRISAAENPVLKQNKQDQAATGKLNPDNTHSKYDIPGKNFEGRYIFSPHKQNYPGNRLTGLGPPDVRKVEPGNLMTEHKSRMLGIIPKKPESPGFGYSLNLMLGPDFSGVGANTYGTGTFAGLGLELYFGNRFSLIAGVSYARKKYAVQDDEYSAPSPGIWTYGQVPDQVDIACHVLDIPINIYYSIFLSRKNRFFAGAGLSTYLMLTEEYHFEYEDSYYTDLIREYTLKNENQHYFGIVNLSAGYTRNINDKWAWQVEPYLKLPIQDIAAAKVRLNSFGALISLKYRFR